MEKSARRIIQQFFFSKILYSVEEEVHHMGLERHEEMIEQMMTEFSFQDELILTNSLTDNTKQ